MEQVKGSKVPVVGRTKVGGNGRRHHRHDALVWHLGRAEPVLANPHRHKDNNTAIIQTQAMVLSSTPRVFIP